MPYPDHNDDTPRDVTVYVLKLEHEKYYVGFTTRHVEERFHEHKNGYKAAYWTQAHKPLHILYTEKASSIKEAHYKENSITRDLMALHGINNVRGGDLTSTEKYVSRFGYYWLEREWLFITVFTIFFFATIYLLIDKFF